MSFNTNKYTRPVLVKTLRSISTSNYKSFNAFVSAFSPRAGVKSAKISSLTKALNTNTTSLKSLFETNVNGASVKNALITLVKNS